MFSNTMFGLESKRTHRKKLSKKRIGVVDWPSTTYAYWPYLEKSATVLLDTCTSVNFCPRKTFE